MSLDSNKHTALRFLQFKGVGGLNYVFCCLIANDLSPHFLFVLSGFMVVSEVSADGVLLPHDGVG